MIIVLLVFFDELPRYNGHRIKYARALSWRRTMKPKEPQIFSLCTRSVYINTRMLTAGKCSSERKAPTGAPAARKWPYGRAFSASAWMRERIYMRGCTYVYCTRIVPTWRPQWRGPPAGACALLLLLSLIPAWKLLLWLTWARYGITNAARD